MKGRLLEKFDAALDENLKLVSAGPLDFYGLHLFNPDDAASYVQLFDAGSVGEVTLGTTAPKQSYFIPAGGSLHMPPECRLGFFKKGLVYAVTAGANNNTAPGADAGGTIWFAQA